MNAHVGEQLDRTVDGGRKDGDEESDLAANDLDERDDGRETEGLGERLDVAKSVVDLGDEERKSLGELGLRRGISEDGASEWEEGTDGGGAEGSGGTKSSAEEASYEPDNGLEVLQQCLLKGSNVHCLESSAGTQLHKSLNEQVATAATVSLRETRRGVTLVLRVWRRTLTGGPARSPRRDSFKWGRGARLMSTRPGTLAAISLVLTLMGMLSTAAPLVVSISSGRRGERKAYW